MDHVIEWQAARLRWAQIYGISLPRSRQPSRLTVRSGHALRLRTAGGEDVWITTSDPATACQVLDRYCKPAPETLPRRDPS